MTSRLTPGDTRLSRSATRTLARLRRWAEAIVASFGVAAGATMASASVLWWSAGSTGNQLIRRTGHGIVTQRNGDFGWGEIAVFAAVAAGFAIPLAVLAWRGRTPVRLVLGAFLPPAIIAPAYASTLPDPTFVGEFPRSVIAELRWPLLALGIQMATMVPFLLWWAFSPFRRQVLRSAGGSFAAVGVSIVAGILIAKGLTRLSRLSSLTGHSPRWRPDPRRRIRPGCA